MKIHFGHFFRAYPKHDQNQLERDQEDIQSSFFTIENTYHHAPPRYSVDSQHWKRRTVMVFLAALVFKYFLNIQVLIFSETRYSDTNCINSTLCST